MITEKDAKLATLEQLLSSTRSELKVSFFERLEELIRSSFVDSVYCCLLCRKVS